MYWLLAWWLSGLVCAIVCAAIASVRRLQVGVWLLVGLACNVLGVLLVAVAKPETPRSPSRRSW